MRRSMLAAVSAAALIAAVAATFTGANAFADDPGSADAAEAPTADQLRDRVEGCETQVSDGLYAERVGMEHDIPVCGTGNAIHWKSGMTIDCDGQSTDNCNSSTDGSYQPETSCVQSDGDYLVADQLPFAVVPLPSSIWDAQNSG
ncbi:MAG: peptidoglycan-binding protein, partial [Stackebrandtia sp.]